MKIPVYPYVVATTGHRSFNTNKQDDELPGFSTEEVSETFRTLLTSLASAWREQCGGTAPMILLTGLADGADRIVAETALGLPEELNVKVIVVLGLKASLFENLVADRAGFRDILTRVHAVYTMPLVGGNQGQPDAALADLESAESKEMRRLQYAVVSEFLAVHSHVTFAFWDGIDLSERPDKKGGTSTVVRFKLEGNPDITTLGHHDTLTYPSVGPVVQIFLPRRYAADEDVGTENTRIPEWMKTSRDRIPVFVWTRDHMPPALREKLKESEALDDLADLALHPAISDVLLRLGMANRDSVKYERVVAVSKPDEDIRIAEEMYDSEAKVLLQHFTALNELAMYFQKHTLRIIKLYVSMMLAFIVVSGALGALWGVRLDGGGKAPDSMFHFLHRADSMACQSWFNVMPALCCTFWIFFVVLVLGFIWAKYKFYHHRYHRYRALAEAFRVQIYWRVAGLSYAVSGFYRSHQTEELNWLRTALNGVDVLLRSPKPFANVDPEKALNNVRDSWVQGQMIYFKNTAKKRREPWKIKARSGQIVSRFLSMDWFFRLLSFVAAKWWLNRPLLVLLSLKLFLKPVMANINTPLIVWQHHSDGIFLLFVILETLATILTGTALVSLLYVRLMRYSQEASRYQSMVYPYQHALYLLSNSRNRSIEEKQSILLDLGTEALAENAEWLLSVGERELTLPR